MKTICKRLHRGDDLKREILRLAEEHHLQAGVLLSATGCLSHLRVRDASGVRIRELHEDVEIVSLMGTVSALRTHLHIACSREDLTTLGGHLMDGCIVNTTCEVVIGILEDWTFGMEEDPETGYDEIVFLPAFRPRTEAVRKLPGSDPSAGSPGPDPSTGFPDRIHPAGPHFGQQAEGSGTQP